MKKAVNILTVLIVILVLAQIVCTFLPYWNLTSAPSILDENPQPTDYSIQQYCWTSSKVMNRVFKAQFLADYGVKYDSNDYVLGLVLVFACSLLTLGFSVVKLERAHYGINAPLIMILCNIASIAWVVFSLKEFFTNFLLTLGVYPMVYTLLLVFTIPAAVLLAVRVVLDVILAVQSYKAAKHA